MRSIADRNCSKSSAFCTGICACSYAISSLRVETPESWSGRRGSNPRPTAWKAVTLPLSYSRLRAAHFAPRFGEAGPLSRRAAHFAARFGGLARLLSCSLARPPASPFFFPFLDEPTSPLACPAVARERFIGERRRVAREGLEPSKPLGRQIYSLLRLTASLPRQESVLLESVCSTRTVFIVCFCQCFLRFGLSGFAALNSIASGGLGSGAGEGIRSLDLLITNQLLYLPELRQPKQKWNYSTSRATGTIPAVSTIGVSGSRLTAALANDLEERDSGGHGHVQTLHVPLHRY